MSPEKQRIAIATACGWTDIRRQRLYLGNQDLWGTKLKGGEKHRNRLPDYLNDKNAMQEVKKVLSDKGLMLEFVNQLVGTTYSAMGFRWEKLTTDDHLILVANATAEQEAEAFLRTLGLWEKDANTAKSASSTSSATEESSVTRLLALAQPVMEAYAKSHELDEWHCRCEDIIGTAYPRKLLDENS